MKKCCFSVRSVGLFMAALALAAFASALIGPPAFAEVTPYVGDMTDVKGLWLDVPSFPGTEFAEDGAKRREQDDEYGYFSFRRGLAGEGAADNRWELVVDRYRHDDETVPGGESFYPLTAAKAKEFLVSHRAIGAKDEVALREIEPGSGSLSYPLAGTRCDFKTGNGEALTSFDTFMFTDDYVFWVHLTVPTKEAEKFTEDDFKTWFGSWGATATGAADSDVTELMLEAAEYPDQARVIEYTRYIDPAMFKISRYFVDHGWRPKTPEEAPDYIRELVQEENGNMDEIKFDPKADAETSKRLNHPVVSARYLVGSNEDTNIVNRLFIYVDEYVFDVEIMIRADDFEDYWPIAAEWLTKLQLVRR
ncbi:MAG: hypothetical protein LBJ64_07350 [Deltaproteobacteria bacterium]|jgi:hypothetical protein|nr:hypothetical protein [Deltaproteobacteria bacterium]